MTGGRCISHVSAKIWQTLPRSWGLQRAKPAKAGDAKLRGYGRTPLRSSGRQTSLWVLIMRRTPMAFVFGLFLIVNFGCDTPFIPSDSIVGVGNSVLSIAAKIMVVAPASTITVGQPMQAQASVLDSAGRVITGANVSWTSSQPSIATVTNDGLITPLKVGDVVISALNGNVKGDKSLSVIGPDAPPVDVPSAAQLPTDSVSTAMPIAPAAGASIISLPANGDLQAALDRAQPGDVIELARGGVYKGNFTLPVKTAGSGWIVIRPAAGVSLPPEGSRMTPALAAAAQLPKIASVGLGTAIQTALGAHHYRLVGVEILPDASVTDQSYGLVGFGTNNDGGQLTLAQAAHDLILDRTYIHGTSTLSLRRCVLLNSARSAVIDSWISDCHDRNADAQAISGWNGPGPFLIRNNHLEASTEVIMFGGGDAAAAELSPADIIITGNYLTKPVAWKGGPWQIKNLLELKNGRRVLIEKNVFDGNWPQAWPDGVAIALKSVDQDGTAPWTGTTDVTFRRNLIRNVGAGMNLHSNPEDTKPAVPMARVTISENVFLGLNSSAYPGSGKAFFLGGSIADLTIDHNTVVWAGSGTAIEYSGNPPQPFAHTRITNNLFATLGGYGLTGEALGWPAPVWAAWAPDGTMTGNVFALAEAYTVGNWNTYPAGNKILVNADSRFAGLGFVDANSGDVRLADSSPLKGFAGGVDPGAAVSSVMAAATSATSGTP